MKKILYPGFIAQAANSVSTLSTKGRAILIFGILGLTSCGEDPRIASVIRNKVNCNDGFWLEYSKEGELKRYKKNGKYFNKCDLSRSGQAEIDEAIKMYPNENCINFRISTCDGAMDVDGYVACGSEIPTEEPSAEAVTNTQVQPDNTASNND